MKIGNFNTSSILGGINMGSIISILFYGMIVIVAIGLIGWYIYSKTKNKMSYSNNITLTQYFDNGTQKITYGLKGGKFINKAQVNDFRIKAPGISFKKKELGYMPDFSKGDADGTLHFLTSGDGNFWQQVEHKLVITQKVIGKDEKTGEETVVDEYSLIMTPIRADIKTFTMNSIKAWSEVLNKNKMTVFGIGLGMFIIMVIAHLISLYIQTKIKCPVVP